MCPWRTFQNEHEITNKITFSAVCAVHGLLLPGHLPTKPASLSYFAASGDCSFQLIGKLFQQLLNSVSFKQMLIFNQSTVFFIERHVYKLVKICHFC